MAIKRGDVVSHREAVEWGVGKIVELGDTRASIHFNDGIVRKISSSHFASLLPAEPGSFMPASLPDLKAAPKARAPRVPKVPKVPKAPKAPKAVKAAPAGEEAA